jgi:hypothetical protein
VRAHACRFGYQAGERVQHALTPEQRIEFVAMHKALG